MLEEITWLKFLEWMSYAELEPFDEVRADLRSAQIVAKIHNLFRSKGDPVLSASDFVLNFGPVKEKPKQTMKEQKNIAYMIATAFAGKK